MTFSHRYLLCNWQHPQLDLLQYVTLLSINFESVRDSAITTPAVMGVMSRIGIVPIVVTVQTGGVLVQPLQAAVVELALSAVIVGRSAR